MVAGARGAGLSAPAVGLSFLSFRVTVSLCVQSALERSTLLHEPARCPLLSLVSTWVLRKWHQGTWESRGNKSVSLLKGMLCLHVKKQTGGSHRDAVSEEMSSRDEQESAEEIQMAVGV